MKILKFCYAKINLAVALIIHFSFKKWFQRRGLSHFLSFYKEDRVFPLLSEERAKFSSYSNCIFCGLCVSQCELTDSHFYEKFLTPANIAFSYTKSLPEVSSNVDFLAHCSSCRSCEKVCPTSVPLNTIIQFVKTHVTSS
ncbi:MAG: 4Fe-4S dicluster domain-containing protein [Deltaproteobacteria bacterium]|nr:4Fe-4S dicluster domain-containing protein [Deltaproteobacteria bacterium]